MGVKVDRAQIYLHKDNLVHNFIKNYNEYETKIGNLEMTFYSYSR